MLGYSSEDLVGSDISQHLHRRDYRQDDYDLLGEFYYPWAEQQGVELFEAHHADGSKRCLEAVVAGLPEGAGAEYAYYFRDVAGRESLQSELVHWAFHEAFHDFLMGLANRDLFMNRLGHVLSWLVRQNQPVAVLFIDFDNFEAVKDEVGHTLGDQILMTTGQRISGCLRPTDTAARFGGDEFTVLLEDIEDVDSVAQGTVRTLEGLNAPVVLGSHGPSVTASVGVTMSGTGLVRLGALFVPRTPLYIWPKAKRAPATRYKCLPQA